MSAALLEVKNLKAYFIGFQGSRVVKAVDDITFSLKEGETLGIVGESGCGKTTTCHALFNLLPPGGQLMGGSIHFDGTEITAKSQKEMQQIRGKEMAMILQDPMASLDPLLSIYDQVGEPAYHHRRLRRNSLKTRVEELLGMVRIPSPSIRMKEFPHQMSGGMRQRIVGAMALAGGPKLIVADEPTTNLDVTIQLQYLELLKELQDQTGVALIFVTHNLGIVAKMCNQIAVMYAGKIVEQGTTRDIFNQPQHPYTDALLKSIPVLGNKDPLYVIPGQPPNLAEPPDGCLFHPRCPKADQRCRVEHPPEVVLQNAQSSVCWMPHKEQQLV